MTITSLSFLGFLALLVLCWYLLPPARRWWAALGAGVWFYLTLDKLGILVLGFTALCVWYCALRLGRLQAAEAEWLAENRTQPKEVRKAHGAAAGKAQQRWLVLGLLLDFGLLFLTKYYGLLAGAVNRVTGSGLWTAQNLLVPLGISYYTLQLAGYLIDVSRTVIPPERNPLRVFTYGSFFLSITQGPFNRYDALMGQMDAETSFSWQRMWYGAQRMAWGYFQKLAVADRAAIVVNKVFDSYTNYSGLQQLFCLFAFAVQLYADFAGYTNIVLGAGELLGLSLPDNFRQPFFSRNMSEFWKRWHITLGLWLQDYLFYPLLKSPALTKLGKTLKGRVSKKTARSIPTHLGLLVLWLAIGLWHGGGLQFLFGVGLLQFLYIYIGELCAPLFAKMNSLLRTDKWPRLFRVWQGLRCTMLMGVAWVFFRAENLGQGFCFLGHMVTAFGKKGFGLGQLFDLGLNRMGVVYLLYGVLVLLVVDLLHEKGLHLRERLAASPLPARFAVYQVALWSFALMAILLSSGTQTFMYAHF